MRLDRALVDRSLARSRGHARDLVLAGWVRVDDVLMSRPSHAVPDDANIEVAAASGPVWVGRAAEKLEAAFERWEPHGLTVRDADCVDVGASTGGFTQVLLRRGARSVVAIDVGSAQLAASLVDEPRVTDLSRRHVLGVTAQEVGAPVSAIVVDVSFISVRPVLAHVAPWCADEGNLVVLVKPQFEVGRSALSRSGVVRSAPERSGAVHRVVDTAYQAGLAVSDAMRSPLTGTHGNREYLLRLAPARAGMMDRAQAHHLVDTHTKELR